MQSSAVDPLLLKSLAVGVWLALLCLAERLIPAAPRPAGDGPLGLWRVLRNGALFALNAGLSPLLVVPVSAFAATVGPDWRPDAWAGLFGGVPALLVDLVLLDLFLYAWHRANHEIPVLWRFHQVHHYDRFLDVSTAVRFHAGEVAASAVVRAVVIVAADVPLAHVLVFETLVLVASVFHHSNLRLPPALERALSRVVVTPAIHWVHHHAVRADTDSNYATLLSVWDPLFGTRSATRRTPDMPVGLEGTTADLSLPALLARPFARNRGTAETQAGNR